MKETRIICDICGQVINEENTPLYTIVNSNERWKFMLSRQVAVLVEYLDDVNPEASIVRSERQVKDVCVGCIKKAIERLSK